HRGDRIDVLADGTGAREFTAERVDTPNTHGTGCTLSSAIAAYLALGRDIPAAVEGAKEYIGAALRSAAGWRLGAGSGPVDHLWAAHPRGGRYCHEGHNSPVRESLARESPAGEALTREGPSGRDPAAHRPRLVEADMVESAARRLQGVVEVTPLK